MWQEIGKLKKDNGTPLTITMSGDREITAKYVDAQPIQQSPQQAMQAEARTPQPPLGTPHTYVMQSILFFCIFDGLKLQKLSRS